jgi:tetraacyldisaccharide 4'-kinase
MKVLLFLFSVFSRFIGHIKGILYRLRVFQPRKAPLKVISVGNIALGGTEKTPLAMELLTFLLSQGARPALISRGYKGKWEKSGGILSDGRALAGSWQESGDEPWMIARSIPQSGVFIGKDRLSSCKRAHDSGFNIAVLDDGFQHRRLLRDLDIVLYSPAEKIALRESVSSLRRAQVILVKKDLEIPGNLKKKGLFPPDKLFAYSVVNKGFFDLDSDKRIPAEAVQGKRVLGFCGIANPGRFFSLLRAGGIEVVSRLTFPDHFVYPPSSFKKISDRYRESGAEAAITTEKDVIKLFGRDRLFGLKTVYYLKIGLDIEEKFYDRLRSFLEGRS